jgi:hypothetical protein
VKEMEERWGREMMIEHTNKEDGEAMWMKGGKKIKIKRDKRRKRSYF